MMFPRTCVVLAAGAGLACSALATEKFDLRYAPGNGGSDMTAPLESGLYFQMPLYAYHGSLRADLTDVQRASTLFTGAAAGLAAVFPTAAAATPVRSKLSVDARALLPRLTWMGTQVFLGATVGATAMVRLVEKRVAASAQVGSTAVSNVDAATLSAATSGTLTLGGLAARTNAAVAAGAAARADAQSGRRFGIGDLEIAPVLRWARDPDQFIFAPTLILPTGQYDRDRAVNPGSGRFWTFRPTLQWGHIGDGWDIGARVAFSINTKNRDTDYRSGNYLNLDLGLMRSVTDDLRLGLTGYILAQTTKDTMDGTPAGSQALTVGKRGRVHGLGPAVAWIKGGGEMLLEARVAREFGAQDRPEGTALWLNVSIPLN